MLAGYSVSRQAETSTDTAAGPVVDDGAEPAPGQMLGIPVLAALRAEVEGVLTVCDPLDEADARAHFPAAFADLAKQDTAGITRSLQQNLPGVEGADAQRYITAAGMAARARAAGNVVAAPVWAAGGVSAVSGLVSALFKARDGAATPADARVVRSGARRRPTARRRRGGRRWKPRTGRTSRTYACTPTPEQGRCPTGWAPGPSPWAEDITFSPGEYQLRSPDR